MDLRDVQRPLKTRYREQPAEARITLSARGSETSGAVACSVDIGRAAYAAQAHSGVGGAGTAPCSGDLLLAALAACAQVTCQMVAAASAITNAAKATLIAPFMVKKAASRRRRSPGRTSECSYTSRPATAATPSQ